MSPNTASMWIKTRLPLSVLAAGIVLSVAAARFIHQEITRDAHAQFNAMGADASRNIKARFDDYTAVLIGLRASLGMSDAITRDQFHRYVLGLNLSTTHPGFQVVNYAPFVPKARKRIFEKSVREEYSVDSASLKNFAISPPGERDAYYPLTYIEPMAGSEAALGNDMGAIPTVLKSLERARDTGEVSSSGRLVRLRRDGPAVGLAIRLAVYRAGMPLDTIMQRRAAYLGSVGAGFRVEDMVANIVKGHGTPKLRLRLLDAGPGHDLHDTSKGPGKPLPKAASGMTDTLLFDSAAAGTPLPTKNDSVASLFPFEAGGRIWLVQVTTDSKELIGPFDRLVSWLALLCGVVLSLLLSGIIYSLTTARARAFSIAMRMTSELRTSEQRLAESQHVASLGSWTVDAQTGAIHLSTEALNILDFDVADTPLRLANILTRIPAEQRISVLRNMVGLARSGERSEFEYRLRLPVGVERWVHVIAEQAQEQERIVWRGTVRDDTARKKAALRLKLEHDVARLLAGEEDMARGVAGAMEIICTQLDWNTAAHWRVGADGLAHCESIWTRGERQPLADFVRLSTEFSRVATGGSLGSAWATADAVWIDTSMDKPGFTRESLAARFGLVVGMVLPVMSGPSPEALEFFSQEARVAEAESLESLRAVAMQIGQYEQRKRAETSLRHVASHDVLTGLANRALLQQSLDVAIKRSHRDRKRLAVLFLDLDRFKQINDTLGHGAGDIMIRTCAARLTDAVRECDRVARFGGDEFVMLLEGLSEAADATVVVNKVLACCAEPFLVDGNELHVTASVGISVYPEDGTDAESLLKNADTALYRAKGTCRGTYQFFTPKMNMESSDRFMLETGLRRAVERNELVLHYQPKLNLRTREITAVEALMRWHHPVLGMISPARFIPIAEETGLIESMGRWALQTACADARAWQKRGLPPLQMSVNLAARQVDSPTLMADVADALQTSGLDPSLLELEITESAMMQNPAHAEGVLQRLYDLGVSLAIDDFGTGYSSLSYLRRFPLSTVKIDRSFINDLTLDRNAEALTDGIIRLAHGLRMKVVAEGVETAEQLACLRAHDCDEIQGFFFCKPLPADAACDFMTRHLRTLFDSTAAASMPLPGRRHSRADCPGLLLQPRSSYDDPRPHQADG